MKRIKLKQLRVGLDLSQEQMADKLAVSRSHYLLIESGKRIGSLKFWQTVQETFALPTEELHAIMYENLN